MKLSGSQKQELQNLLEGAAREAGVALLEGAREDIAKFAKEIALSMATALEDGDEEWQDEIQAQLVVLAELQRIRATNVSWDAFTVVLRGFVKVGLGMLSAGLAL